MNMIVKKILIAVLSIYASFWFNNYTFYSNDTYCHIMIVVQAIIFLCFGFLSAKTKLKKSIPCFFLSLLEALFVTIGKQFTLSHHLNIGLCLTGLLTFPYFYIINNAIFNIKQIKIENSENKFVQLFNKHWFRILAIMLLWLPYLLAYFPGATAADTILAVLSYEQGIHHYNLLYTLVYVILNMLFPNEEIGTLIIALIQMLIMSTLYSKSIEILKLPNKIAVFITLWIGLCYSSAMWAVFIEINSIFTAALICFLCLIYKEIKEGLNLKERHLFLIVGFISCTFRKNFIYAFIPVLIYLLFKKLFSKKTTIATFVMLLLCAFNALLPNSLGFKDTKLQEMSSLPMQQMVRSYAYGNINKNEEGYLRYITRNNPCSIDHYNPVISDYVKHNLRIDDFKEFLLFYFKIGLKNLGQYIEAPLENNYYLFYPESIYKIYTSKEYAVAETVAKLSENGATKKELQEKINKLNEANFINKDYFVTSFTKTKPLAPSLYKLLYKISFYLPSYEIMPISFMLFSYGTYFWIFLTAFFIAIERKNKTIIVLGFLMLLYIGTIFLGPCIVNRYVFKYIYYWQSLPHGHDG